METLLDVQDLTTSFHYKKNKVAVVDKVNFSIKRGETVALVGESGCGKSMTSLSIMGLVPSQGSIGGDIQFDGINLSKLSEDEMCKIRGKEISMIFQEPMTSLNPVMTIGEQLAEVIVYHQKVKHSDAMNMSIDLLKLVGFSRPEEIVRDYPHRLSGGMRQRVMIAMAMSCNPKLLIADEPTTALDVTVQAQILDLMRELSQKFNTSILLITHDLGVVSELAERVIVMYAGQVVEQATIEELFEQPKHPYTIGLIESIPQIEGAIKRLSSIPGNVPTPDHLPKGCRFSPRCSRAFGRCFEEEPTLKRLNSARTVRCFLYEEETECMQLKK